MLSANCLYWFRNVSVKHTMLCSITAPMSNSYITFPAQHNLCFSPAMLSVLCGRSDSYMVFILVCKCTCVHILATYPVLFMSTDFNHGCGNHPGLYSCASPSGIHLDESPQLPEPKQQEFDPQGCSMLALLRQCSATRHGEMPPLLV